MNAGSTRGQVSRTLVCSQPPEDVASVLVATVDATLSRIVNDAARLLLCTAGFVRSGSDAMARALSHSLKVLLLDQHLPDSTGLEVGRALRRDAVALPFILIGRGFATSVTVEAMKLGALTVLEKPVALREIVATIRPLVVETLVADTAVTAREPPRSIAERWALHVVKACEADKDLRTLAAWASFVGVSYSSLCESCRMLGIQPLEARDLTRVLRAVIGCHRDARSIEELLDISDRRTLKALLGRSGLERVADYHDIPVGRFLASQRFVPLANPGLGALRALLRLDRSASSRTAVPQVAQMSPIRYK